MMGMRAGSGSLKDIDRPQVRRQSGRVAPSENFTVDRAKTGPGAVLPALPKYPDSVTQTLPSCFRAAGMT